MKERAEISVSATLKVRYTAYERTFLLVTVASRFFTLNLAKTANIYPVTPAAALLDDVHHVLSAPRSITALAVP